MNRILYLDGCAGVSGDMFVGALLDLGADLERIRAQLAGLELGGFTVQARRVRRGGVAATKFAVLDPETGVDVDQRGGVGRDGDAAPAHRHRGLAAICTLLQGAGLPPEVLADAVAIFERLAAAEAKVHGVSAEEIHFHEVGAVDSIVDVVSAACAVHQLGVEQISCAPLHVGAGVVHCAHGALPVPAPATAELLRGVPVYAEGTGGELVTPTGAALVRHYCSRFGGLPTMVMERIGYGAGTREWSTPNVLRAILGSACGAGDDKE